jgi:hypothetical protein
LKCAEARLYNFAQCQCGSEYEKYTTLAATSGWAQLGREQMAVFDNKRCLCTRPHAKTARGKDAAAAATYPKEMNLAVARCVLRIVEARRQHAKLADASMAVNLRARRKAMTLFYRLIHSQQTEEAVTVHDKAPWKYAGEMVQPKLPQPTLIDAFSRKRKA